MNRHAEHIQTIRAQLKPDEQAFLDRCVAKLPPEGIARIAQLTVPDAIATLRSEMRRDPLGSARVAALTTRDVPGRDDAPTEEHDDERPNWRTSED